MSEILKISNAMVAYCKEAAGRHTSERYNILLRDGDNRTRSVDMISAKHALLSLSAAVGSPSEYGLAENWLVRVATEPSTDRVVAIGHIIKDNWYVGEFNDLPLLCDAQELRRRMPSFEYGGTIQLNAFIRGEPRVCFRFEEKGIVSEQTLQLEFEGTYQNFSVRLHNPRLDVLSALCWCADVNETSKLKNRLVRLRRCSEGDVAVGHIMSGSWHGIGYVYKIEGELPAAQAA